MARDTESLPQSPAATGSSAAPASCSTGSNLLPVPSRRVRQRHSADVEPMQLLSRSPAPSVAATSSPASSAITASSATTASSTATAISTAEPHSPARSTTTCLNKWLLLKSNKHVPKSLLNSWSKVYKNSLMLSPDGSVRHAGECGLLAAQCSSSTTTTPGGTLRKVRAPPSLRAAALPPALPASLGGNPFNALQPEVPSLSHPRSARAPAAATSLPSSGSSAAAVSPSASATRPSAAAALAGSSAPVSPSASATRPSAAAA